MREVLTPLHVSVTRDLAAGLVFRKQILPQDTINYEGRQLTFDDAYMQNLVKAFNDAAYEQVPFVLADSNNQHTMDPELVRGEVTAVSLAEPGEDPGLYATISFSNAAAAKAVLINPRLPVSCRILEGIEKSDGRKYDAALMHVCGTLDPRVTGMSPWRKVDLSGYDTRVEHLDLTASDWSKAVTAAATDPNTMTPEQIREWVANLSDAELAELYNETDPNGGGDEGDVGDDPADPGTPAEPELATAGATNLSTTQQRAIDLANATAATAQQRADEALRRAADAEWRETRQAYLLAGVPPHEIDLTEPILNRPFPMVIDLTAEGSANVNVNEIVRKLLDARKGTIDLSTENGHGGHAPGEKDPDEETLALWDQQFGH